MNESQQTLSIIKPDAVERNLVEEIKDIFKKNNLSIKNSIKTTTYFLAICQIFIAYLEQYVLPRGRYLRRIGQIFIICPITLISIILNQIFPKRDEYFSSIVQLGVSTKPIK